MANVNYKDNEHNYVVSKPIVLTSVADLLGTNIKDLKRLCMSDKINMWARYKPFKSTTLFFGQDSDTTGTVVDRDNALKACNFGLSKPSSRSLATIANCMTDVWTYDKPTGTTYPARLADFNHYAHRDKPPIISAGDFIIDLFFDYDSSYTLGSNTVSGSVYKLTLNDFGITNTYPNLAIMFTNGSITYIKVFNGIPQQITLSRKALTDMPFPVSDIVQYCLMLTNHPEKELDVNTEFGSSYSWFAIPNDGTYKHGGNITFVDDFHVSISCNGYSTDSATSWVTKTPPYGRESTTFNSMEWYLPPNYSYNKYTIYLRMSFYNTGTTGVKIKLEDITFNLGRNLTMTTATPKVSPSAMYDASGNSITEFNLAAGESKNIGFKLADYFFTMDSRQQHSDIVVSNRNISTMLYMYYHGVVNAVNGNRAGEVFRIRDYTV